MLVLPMHLLARAVRAALQEDIGAGDLTCEAVVPADQRGRAIITAGEPLVAAGLEAARYAFAWLDPGATFNRAAAAGSKVGPGEVLLEITGGSASLLTAERTALNFLGRLSGVATLTRRCVEAVAGTSAAVYDTRKTTPGLRLLERQAVALGGGVNHRAGLFDAVLIKDNHIAAAGGIAAAVRAAVTRYNGRMAIEVEVETLDQLREALEGGAAIVLLDNMTIDLVAESVALARSRPGRAIQIEVSGGITPDNIREYALTGVDRISLGCLTHSAPAADVSMSFVPLTRPGARGA